MGISRSNLSSKERETMKFPIIGSKWLLRKMFLLLRSQWRVLYLHQHEKSLSTFLSFAFWLSSAESPILVKLSRNYEWNFMRRFHEI
jgi:hypothetical protein